ncbi:MAG: EAL domain-containing protein [Gammaproteobacteria bacterium]|uniref:bifunctional diguanylate cyclase/phosphodiesterase n=1 Tax=Rhodoferax sp. TaxID=50421 RepID=UPI001E005BF5|nr:EAL domain-containing protein [Rhodoferax sp.]MBU3898366.1 EAL domain-containing protein [Gammaproteobacteria bacterium]MBU3998085.1 EAL domain-containing protein [Gammaproteobacteria bacterium]MBU4019607.1 EAL domain-containing protein [Gammaproteobacteria bacterium]MBU4079140.1 EAL domain-containing protein [Gammaproteobacteria bacterium]MBU4113795.1 EAL domain-containing protein [Gammaproteobacteria bacterium]
MPRSLRSQLWLELSTLIALAVLAVIATLLGVLLPRLNADVVAENRRLGVATAAHIESFLTNFSTEIDQLAEDIAAKPALPASQRQRMLDTLANAHVNLDALYLVNASDQVTAVGLPTAQRATRDNLIGVDFSGRGFVTQARRERRIVWSDTYLSSRGQIVVGVALPLPTPAEALAPVPGVLVGELNLAQVSRFAAELAKSNELLPIIVDQRGNIVGHPDAQRALHQDNISYLPLLHGAVASRPQTDRFTLDGIDYIGNATPIKGPGWTALVAQPSEQAFATVRSTLLALAAGSVLALLLAVIMAIIGSRRMMRRVTQFSEQMHAIANGDFRATIPRSNIEEIESLARSMREMANAVLEREARLQLAASVFTHAREGITITDAAGTIVEVNDTFSLITGYSREEVLGQNSRLLQSGRQGPDFYAAMWKDLAGKGHWYGEVWNRRKNGELYAEMLTVSAVRDGAGKTQNYVALFSDITSVKQHQSQLEHIAHYDTLTGLPNRLLLADRLHQAILQSQRHSRSLAVVFLDLDHFKAVNDAHGHNIGDELLVALALRMKAALRDEDTLARLGGDEFVAVLVDLAQPQDCEPVLARLLQAASDPITAHEQVLQISASIGVTLYPQDGGDADLLLRHADQAMYAAKQSGRNRYHLFDVVQDAAMQTQHESLEQIRRALEREEFVLFYQPKVNMKTQTVIGAEALIRWQHPERGLLAPACFLPVIEGHPISVAMGEWVINAALTQMSKWYATGLNLPVSVNLGAHQLQQDDFVSRLTILLGAHPDVPRQCVELEVLETSALEDMAKVSRVMQSCREIGVRFALDDFGTGYSSLTYLKRLPAQVLKIDQSFVRDMLVDADDLAIVTGIIGLARAFDREVIAEGVETPAHGQLLLSLGCELAQGYGIARPMSALALAAWVASWQAQQPWCTPA